jgi:hypothetical protein
VEVAVVDTEGEGDGDSAVDGAVDGEGDGGDAHAKDAAPTHSAATKTESRRSTGDSHATLSRGRRGSASSR